MVKLVEFLVEDVIDKFDQVGVKPNPLNEEEIEKVFESQLEAFLSTSLMFPKLLDHFKDAIECFFILCHQKGANGLREEPTAIVLQIMEKSRYLIGDLMEEIRQIEINHEEKKKLMMKFESSQKPKRQKGLEKYKTVGNGELDVVSMINELYNKKFSRPNGRFFTRESKVNLGNE